MPRRSLRRPASALVSAGVLLGLLATGGPAAAAQEAEPTTPAERRPPCGYPESSDYRVLAGDTLYGIARCTLGDGSRYLEIFELNEGVRQDDGGRLTDPSILRVGWLLGLPPEIPPGPGPGPGPGPAPGGGTHTVVAGDSLSSIAAARLGDASRYPEIFALNQGRPQAVGGTLTDPSVLRVGWVLRLPAGGGDGEPPSGGGQPAGSYTVRAGDSLTGIARDQLGDPARWREIFDLNVGRPQPDGGRLTDPSVIEVGWVLRLPAA